MMHPGPRGSGTIAATCNIGRANLMSAKMLAQRDAIVRLLQDDDPDTVRMVKEQLEQLALGGDDALGDLRELAADTCFGTAATHARNVVEEIASHEAEDQFHLLCLFFRDENDLEKAAWMLARAVDPLTDTSPCEWLVNEWGREFLRRTPAADSNEARVGALSAFLAGELGFRGNSDDYYSERNSLLTSVVESRRGIPLSLALLYQMVAIRAGMRVEGINLPGHFIARHGDVLFDPFHGGRILTQHDCEEILERQNLTLRPSHLESARPRQVLLRMLANLLYVYDLRHDSNARERVKIWITALSRDV